MRARQPSWDKYEAVILLDALIKIKEGRISRDEAVTKVSGELRQMAVNNGVKIDAFYRNETGIRFQMGSMESAYTGKTVSIPSTRLFSEVVKMYRNNRDEYEKILVKARGKIGMDNKKNFYKYLEEKVSPAQLSALYNSYGEIEYFCTRMKVLNKPLFETDDLDTLNKVKKLITTHKAFAVTHRKTFSASIAAISFYITYIETVKATANNSSESDATLSSEKAEEVRSSDIEEHAEPLTDLILKTDKDKEYYEKFPEEYRKLFCLMQGLLKTASASAEIIYKSGSFKMDPAIFKDMLKNVSWAKADGPNRYLFNSEETEQDDNLSEAEDNNDSGVCLVDFNNMKSFAFTSPLEIKYFDEYHSQVSSWRELYLKVVSRLVEDYPHKFTLGMVFSDKAGTRMDFADETKYSFMQAPGKIPNTNFYAETNINATQTLQKIKFLLDLCNVDYENLVIKYCAKKDLKDEGSHKKDKSVSKAFLAADPALEDFSHWILVQGLSESSAKGYSKAIRQAENYAKSHSFTSCVLVTDNRALCIATVNELFSSNEFIVYNHEQHNRFRAAITKLLEFYGLEYRFSHYNFKNKRGSDEVIKHDNDVKPDEGICSILMSRYEYGFKCDSLRELMRFRQAADEMGISLSNDDEELKAAIISSGILIDGKVYCKNEDMLKELQQIVTSIFASGAEVIYYESLFEANWEWMGSYAVTSPEMLKEYLKRCVNNCSFSKRFMTIGDKYTEKEAVANELKRVWGSNPINSVYELRDRLPYIPYANICRALSGSDDFVFSAEGEYLFIERFRITKDDENAILGYVDETYEENGFVSLSDIPIESVEEENYELPKFAIYNAVYKKILRDKYNLKGKILTKDQNDMGTVMLLKKYIKEKDKCTFDEVAYKVKELTGGINRQYAFQALYDEMVRVDLNRFISTKSVDFKVDETDSAISEFITDGFCAIREITTFAMFPLCNQSWNHYLLESFCYKYSKKYSLCIINFNDKNVGIIAEKDYNKKYDDMLVIAAARSGVELSPEAVGKYLSETGYMTKSKFSRLDDITKKASELRKERK